ncbi:MAG: NHL repeat-containing protein, partial [Chloroflexota bacterium]
MSRGERGGVPRAASARWLARAGSVFVVGLLLLRMGAGVALASYSLTTLVSSGLSNPASVAVDGAGNVYIADVSNNAVKEWVKASNTVTILVSSGLSGPNGVAVDAGGNVYIADSWHWAVKEWVKASNTVTTLVSSGLNGPRGVAVDASGNVYIADTGDNAIK